MDAVTWIHRRYARIESLGDSSSPVHKARDRLSPAGTGLVVLKEALDPSTRAALVTEVELLLRLDHPALRRVIAYGEDDRCQLAVMEYVAGCDLATHLGLHPDDAGPCAEEVLRTLVYLHAQGRAHVDLKPANILVDGGVTRLIDLGLSTPLGKPPPGGTHGFLPPEYERGEATSVAGDLYSFGATFRGIGAALRERDEILHRLIEACLSENPRARPASADGALAMLEALPRPVDRSGQLRRAGGVEALTALEEILTGLGGATVVVRGAPGSGRTRLIRDALRPALLRGQPVADVSARGGHDPFRTLAGLMLTGLPDDPLRAAAMGVAAAARAGVSIVIDDSDEASPQMRLVLPAVTTTLAELGCGAMAVVGADDELAEALEALGATVVDLSALSHDAVTDMLRASGSLNDEAMASAIHRGADGRAGRCAIVALSLAEHPEISPTKAERLARSGGEDQPSQVAPSRRGLTQKSAVIKAEKAFSKGAVDEAASIIESAFSDLRVRPGRRVKAASLLARIDAQCGRLEDAASLVLKLGKRAPELSRLEAARWLERLGRYEEARTLGAPLLDSRDAAVRHGAAAVASTAAFGLGEPSTADDLAREALETPDLPAQLECRLLCVRSDVALTQGDPGRAIEHAEAAQRAAERQTDPTMLPQAIAREAAGYALGGEPRRARDRYRASLDAALKAGDVVGLPPHVLNLATAEHALGELGPAVERYQQAARLAGRLGRAVNRAAALVNWAGLLVDIGAMDEAAQVLDDAEIAARQAGSALYLAQGVLVRASLQGRRSPEDGRKLATQARKAFLECGAERQALEAELLDAELAVDIGERRLALELTTARRDDLDRGGLGARATLLRARVQLLEGEFDEALLEVDRSCAVAESDGDADLEARALGTKALIHSRLGTGAEQPLLLKARELVGKVAARLPAGLRERYLQEPSRLAVARTRGEGAGEGLGGGGGGGGGSALAPRRILDLVRRLVLEGSEHRLLEAAVDEAIDLVGAERAFLLRRRPRGRPYVAVARNIDRETIGKRRASARFSRSVADRVLKTGEQVVTTSATSDPSLAGARSILDLGLRSILCVPIRGPEGVAGALYLDNRFETSRFGPQVSELVQALGDVIGVALENARLKREAEDKALELEEANSALARENELRAAEVDRLGHLLEVGGQRVRDAPGGMIGRSEALHQAVEVVRRVAPSTLPVLVEGESGTGKELLARFVHDSSLRRGGPFMAINCGAVPDSLLESELFGHVKGAFTGATRDHPGLFRAATGGTVLLDEIGEMSPQMQPRLLRILQEGELWPLGMNAPVPVDVRIVAATNRDLEREVEAGRFRHDLFFRLVGARVRVPPLRERLEDLPLLSTAFLERILAEPGSTKVRLSRQAMREMLRHSWPGNIRELEQTLRRAALLCPGETIRPADLGLAAPQATRQDALRSFDRDLVIRTLRAHGGNRTHAAKALGVSRSTLHRWIVRYEL